MTSMFTTGGIRGHGKRRISKFYPRTHNMGITRETYNIVGEFGSLRHGQDIEYSNRIRKSGAKISFIENALVYHRRRSTFRQFFKQVFNWGIARINLGKIDSDSFFTFFITGLLVIIFFSFNDSEFFNKYNILYFLYSITLTFNFWFLFKEEY
jgi:GT2 family glycosyltransferase